MVNDISFQNFSALILGVTNSSRMATDWQDSLKIKYTHEFVDISSRLFFRPTEPHSQRITGDGRMGCGKRKYEKGKTKV